MNRMINGTLAYPQFVAHCAEPPSFVLLNNDACGIYGYELVSC